MNKLFALIIFCAIVNTADAQLYFKNSSSKPVSVAYAMEYKSKSIESWYTHGWYNVDPGETAKISSAVGLNPNVYWYAKSQDGSSVWKGVDKNYSSSFLVADDAFTIKNANFKYVKDANPSYDWKSFRRVKIGTLRLKYTIEITD